jgi:hypothetical protein
MAPRISGAAEALDLPQDRPPNLEHEFDLVRSAVALLSAGGARRVTLVGLPLDGDARREIDSLVRASGMVVRAVVGNAGWDITIEASG